MYSVVNVLSEQTQNICITFVQRRPNIFDVHLLHNQRYKAGVPQ